MNNLELWNAVATTDPRFTKQITGRPYRGTSPNPQYLVMKATEHLGPCGMNWGWDIMEDSFQPLGNEVLHWCRIRFWHGERSHYFDVYGQTRAFYTTNNGKALVDEDAPKKSLTDALVKALSYLGFAADIFLGRYDDQKYVAEVNAEYRAEERAETDAAKVARDRQRLEAAENRDTLAAVFGVIYHEWGKAPPAELVELKDARYIKFARDDLALCETKNVFDETCISIRDHFGGWSKIPHDLMEAIKSKKAEFPEPKETEK